MSKIMPVKLKSLPYPQYPAAPSSSWSACATDANGAGAIEDAGNEASIGRELGAKSQSLDSKLNGVFGDPEEDGNKDFKVVEDTDDLDESIFDVPTYASIVTSIPLNEWVIFPPSEDLCLTQPMIVKFRPNHMGQLKQGPAVTGCYIVKPAAVTKYSSKMQPVYVVPFYSMIHTTLRFYMVPILPEKRAWTERLGVFSRFRSNPNLKTKIVRGVSGQMRWDFEEQDNSSLDWSFVLKKILLGAIQRQKLVLE